MSEPRPTAADEDVEGHKKSSAVWANAETPEDDDVEGHHKSARF